MSAATAGYVGRQLQEGYDSLEIKADEKSKGPSIYYVCKILRFFDPQPPVCIKPLTYTNLPAFSDTFGIWEKCHCKQR